MFLFVTKKETFRLPVQPEITNLLFFCVFIDVIRKILTSYWNTSWPRISIQRLVRNISSRLNFRSWKQKQFHPHSFNMNVTTRGQRFHTCVSRCALQFSQFLTFVVLVMTSWPAYRTVTLTGCAPSWLRAVLHKTSCYVSSDQLISQTLVSELRETGGVTEDLLWLSSGSNVFSKEKKRKQTPENRTLPVHEAAVLEVITVTSDLQLPAGEALPLIKSNLQDKRSRSRAFIHWNFI